MVWEAKPQQPSSHTWHAAEPTDGWVCLYCTCMLSKSCESSRVRKGEKWASARQRNSQFVLVLFTQKPRRVIACSTPQRWKVGWGCPGRGCGLVRPPVISLQKDKWVSCWITVRMSHLDHWRYLQDVIVACCRSWFHDCSRNKSGGSCVASGVQSSSFAYVI